MEKKYLTVTALTKYIKRKLDTDPHLTHVWLKGEISNFKHHSRGHMYFTLKDDKSQIRAVMFAGYNRSLKFRPEDGMSVFIQGEVSVFEPFGQYQIYVHEMVPDGIGSLYLAFEQLKEKLKKEGWFSEKYKREIPRYPETIGIVTSQTGAAIQDILSVLKSRYPSTSIIIFPALVQGEHAAESIVSAIKSANNSPVTLDVLIVGRGGGSIEDLWPFNEEIVARAIFHSKIPIITAIGHETDTTIADFVADMRAPTPTGAATLAVPDQQELIKTIKQLQNTLVAQISQMIKNKQKNLRHLYQSYAFRYPDHLMKQKDQYLDQKTDEISKGFKRFLFHKIETFRDYETRLNRQFPNKKLSEAHHNFQQANHFLQRAMERYIEDESKHLKNTLEKLSLLSPLETLKRGFAIPYREDGMIIKSKNDIQQEAIIDVKIADGHLNCKVLNVRGNKNDEGK